MYTVPLVNGSEYPIFDIKLIGGRFEKLTGPDSHREPWPEWHLEAKSSSLGMAVLLPSQRHDFRGNWEKDLKVPKEAKKGSRPTKVPLGKWRPSYTWTDDQGRAWLRDGSEPAEPMERPLDWGEEYGDEPPPLLNGR